MTGVLAELLEIVLTEENLSVLSPDKLIRRCKALQVRFLVFDRSACLHDIGKYTKKRLHQFIKDNDTSNENKGLYLMDL